MREPDLGEQLAFEPQVERGPLSTFSHVVACGMGGSGLPLYALQLLGTRTLVTVHQDYDLPGGILPGTLAIAVSHSGNTEETLSFARTALERELPLAVVTCGGELLALAEENNVPTVRIPFHDIVPRDTLPALTRSLLWLMNEQSLYDQFAVMGADFEEAASSLDGREEELRGKIAVVYTSVRNAALGHLWRSMLAETAKMPAFANVFPEANHNEMQGLAAVAARDLQVVLVKDSGDDMRVMRRFEAFEEVARERGLSVTVFDCPEASRPEQLIGAWVRSRAVALALARGAGVEPYEVPFITEFKKRL